MKDYVIINGVNSNTKLGLGINILPPITKPKMRTLIEEIDGRDGDLITKLGYSAYDKTIEIGLFGNGYDVDDIIAFFNQEGTITFSNEPDKYYNFTTIDDFDIERLLQFKTSTITFHCQPFKYLIDEEPKEIEYQYVTDEGTEITLNNTKNALMQLELNPSELTQETTTGKNLFQKIASGSNGTLTLTANDDGSYTLNGTPSSSVNFSLTGKSLEAGQYSLQCKYEGTLPNNINNRAQVYSAAQNFNLVIQNSQASDMVTNLTLSNNATDVQFRIRVEGGFNYQNVKLYPMLVKGSYTSSTIGEFEKFTGGIPQPNPSYPSEVQVIKGNNSIKIENKNILPKPASNGSSTGAGQGITLTYNTNNEYKLVGTALANGNAFGGDLVNNYTIKENDYLHLCNATKPTGTIQIVSKDENNNQLFAFTINSTNQVINLSNYVGKKIRSFFFYCISGASVDMLITPMIVNNVSSAIDYIPHQEQVLPLNLPVENLLESTLTEKTVNGVVFTPVYKNNKLDYINVNGTATADTRVPITETKTFTLKQNNDYTLSGCPFGGSSSSYSLYINLTGQVDVGNGLSFTRTSSTSNTNISIDIKSGTVCNNLHFKPMIENSLNVNSYTPYGRTPIEYCKIGDYEDEFEHDGDKWYLNKYIGKSIFTGANTESWNKETVDGKPNYYINISTAKGGNTNPIMCNIGIYGGSVIGDGNNHKCYISNGKNLNYRCDEITTLENFRTMLGNTNMVVYYQFATPTHDEITDTTLINQLNAIEQAVSYDGQTNISQTNTGLPFRIKATAMISGSDEVEIINRGNTYAKPVLDIKGNGLINVYLNGTQMFSVNITDEIIVDIANLESYNPNTSALMNRNVTGDISQFVIPVGTNTISVDGAVETVTITMYERWL